LGSESRSFGGQGKNKATRSKAEVRKYGTLVQVLMCGCVQIYYNGIDKTERPVDCYTNAGQCKRQKNLFF
jgi:hypothetical protein